MTLMYTRIIHGEALLRGRIWCPIMSYFRVKRSAFLYTGIKFGI